MYSKPSLDIDLDEEYVLGLIDYLSRPSLVPYKSGNGYGLDAKVKIYRCGSRKFYLES